MSFPINMTRQVRHAYLDMPGLSLTLPQMRRLFDANDEECAAATAALIATGLLTRRGEQYVRRASAQWPRAQAVPLPDPGATPRPRARKATFDSRPPGPSIFRRAHR